MSHNKRNYITPTEARRSLHALDVLSGRVTEPPPPRKKPQQREAAIQRKLFEWAACNFGKYPELQLMFHIPNEGKRNIINASNLKAAGLKAGVPDICLPVARSGFHGLYIELKVYGGRLKNNQLAWITALSKQSYAAVVCFGFDEARTAIEDYLSGSLVSKKKGFKSYETKNKKI